MLDGSNVALILAGGFGERFWPLSTPNRPKQLLNLTDSSQSLLSEALQRATPLFGRSRIFIGTGPRISEAIRESGLIDPAHTFIEPAPRNTLGAICWALAQFADRGFPDDTVMAVLTADHAIGNPDVFERTIVRAVNLARKTGGLVTIGITPSRPETGYGYIRIGDAVEGGFKIRSFVEKPNAATARTYIEQGGYLWNSGMFFWTLGALRREIQRFVPYAAAVLERLPADVAAFEEMPSQPIDRAVMERTDQGYVVPGEFEWDDVGAWDAMVRIRPTDEDGNVAEGQVAQMDCRDCILYSEDVPLGAIGLEDLIVVVTPNGVLACRKEDAQRVRELLPLLHQSRSS